MSYLQFEISEDRLTLRTGQYDIGEPKTILISLARIRVDIGAIDISLSLRGNDISPSSSSEINLLGTDSGRSVTEIIVCIVSCCEEGRTPREIMSHCKLAGKDFEKYMNHCVNHKMIRLQTTITDMGGAIFVTTKSGRHFLETIDKILEALGDRPSKEVSEE